MQHANLTNWKLIFVRHGEYSRNDDGRQQHLTEAGRAQAEAVGQWMKNICSITMIWHSHMARSAETAQIVAGILSPRLPMQVGSMDAQRSQGYGLVSGVTENKASDEDTYQQLLGGCEKTLAENCTSYLAKSLG